MIVFLQLHAYESMKESLFKSAADNAKLNSGHMPPSSVRKYDEVIHALKQIFGEEGCVVITGRNNYDRNIMLMNLR